MRKFNFIPDNTPTLGAGNIGLENNNAGNIRYSPNINWQGQVGERYGFVVFSSMPYGYRALIKNLQAYIGQGTDTIATMINKWCPQGDGCNTSSYINHVEQRTGISRNKKINANDLNALSAIAGAISISEIGEKFDNHILTAVQMLQGSSPADQQTQPSTTTKRTKLINTFTAIGVGVLFVYGVNKLSKKRRYAKK